MTGSSQRDRHSCLILVWSPELYVRCGVMRSACICVWRWSLLTEINDDLIIELKTTDLWKVKDQKWDLLNILPLKIIEVILTCVIFEKSTQS